MNGTTTMMKALTRLPVAFALLPAVAAAQARAGSNQA
jgi:hypothetical protein